MFIPLIGKDYTSTTIKLFGLLSSVYTRSPNFSLFTLCPIHKWFGSLHYLTVHPNIQGFDGTHFGIYIQMKKTQRRQWHGREEGYRYYGKVLGDERDRVADFALD